MIPAKYILVAFLAIHNVNFAIGANEAAKEELIKFALEHLAPFTETALARIHSEIFGSGRAARSSDIAVINKSDRKFRLKTSNCQWGGFTSDLFPEYLVEPRTSTVYGIESNGFMAGVTCTIIYEELGADGSGNGNEFSLWVDNPYIGSNKISTSVTGDFQIVETLGQGNNNQVRFVVQ